MKILNIAHRGYSGKFDENTMIAFKKAVKYGADGIEAGVDSIITNEIEVFNRC